MMARLAHLDTKRAKARTAELLEQFDLTEIARKPTATYSGGMGRRLDLAMSLMLNPPSSSSTSRPPASTRADAPSCGTSCAGWQNGA
jgi:ABC-type arginine transport system ATPase subunit